MGGLGYLGFYYQVRLSSLPFADLANFNSRKCFSGLKLRNKLACPVGCDTNEQAPGGLSIKKYLQSFGVGVGYQLKVGGDILPVGFAGTREISLLDERLHASKERQAVQMDNRLLATTFSHFQKVPA